jgi:hypothetical protein
VPLAPNNYAASWHVDRRDAHKPSGFTLFFAVDNGLVTTAAVLTVAGAPVDEVAAEFQQRPEAFSTEEKRRAVKLLGL